MHFAQWRTALHWTGNISKTATHRPTATSRRSQKAESMTFLQHGGVALLGIIAPFPKFNHFYGAVLQSHVME